MGLTKQYLRVSHSNTCNVVASTRCNCIYVNKQVCAVGACENVQLWNLRTLTKVCTLSGSDVQVTALTISPDLSWFATGYQDGNIRVFLAHGSDPMSLSRMKFVGHKSAVNYLTFDKSSLRLASGGMDCVINVWDIVNECGLFSLSAHKGPVTKLAFIDTSGKNLLVSSSKDSFIKFWDLDAQHCFYTMAGYRSEIWDFLLLKDSSHIVVGSGEAELRIYAIAYLDDGSSAAEAEADLKRMKLNESSKDQKLTDTDDEDQANGILRCSKLGSILRETKGRVTSLALTSDERILICAGIKNVVEVFYVFSAEETSKKLAKRIRKTKRKITNESIDVPVSEEMFSKDLSLYMKRIGKYSLRAKVKTIDTCALQTNAGVSYKALFLLTDNSVEEVKLFPPQQDANNRKECEFESANAVLMPGHRTDVRSITLSQDESVFVSACSSSLKLWNRSTCSCIRTFECQNALCTMLVSGDRYTVVGDKTGAISVYNMHGKGVLSSNQSHDGAVWGFCLSPDQKSFVSCSADKTVRFWDFTFQSHSDETVKELSIKESRALTLPDDVLCVKISDNSKFIAVGLLDNTAKIFFYDTLKFFLALYGHSLPVLCLDISTDSTIIITGSADKNVKIWGLDFGDCHKSLFAHDESVTCVKFMPKTHLFFSAGKDGKIKQWDADNFERIQTLENGHHNEIWALSVGSVGNFLVSASHDKSIRVWEKTMEPLILEEEHEMEREKDDEKHNFELEDVVPGEVQGEAAMAGRKTVETVKSAENVIDALQICRDEKLADLETPNRKETDRHPMIRMLRSGDLTEFIVDTMLRIKPAELQKSLLILPFSFVLEMLSFLADAIERPYQLEVATKAMMFLTKVYHNQLVNSNLARPLIDKLRSVTLKQLQHNKDQIGYNLAAMRFLQLELAEREEVSLFQDASLKLKENKKRKKKFDKAYVLSAA